MEKSVKITGYLKRFRKSDNSPFFVFTLFGGPIARISSTGKLSLSTPVVTVPANSLDENILKACIGMELSGSIVAEECAPVEFVNAQGIKGIRRHNWIFKPTAAPLTQSMSTPEVEVTEEVEEDQQAAPLTQSMSSPEVEVTEDVEDLPF